MKNKVVFLVHTEYHLMVALSVYADVYSRTDQYEVVIYQTDTGEKKRFQFDFDFSVIPKVTYRRFFYNEGNGRREKKLADQLKEILSNDAATFVSFNQHSIVDVYLMKSFSKKGALIALAPDGTKPYGRFQRKAWGWRFKTSSRYLNFILKNQLSWTPLYSFPLRYGEMKEIQELWLVHVNGFDNSVGKKIRNIAVLETDASRELVNAFFNTDFKTNLPVDNVLLYLNQPFSDQRIFEIEEDVLAGLIKKFPTYKFVVKLHPQSGQKVITTFKAMGATIVLSSFPAELYISLLKNSLIVNFWSAASLLNNKHCRFYWLKPMLIEKGLMLNNVSVENPTTHIMEVQHINQIV